MILTRRRNLSSYHRFELMTCALMGHQTYKPVGSQTAEKLAVQLSAHSAGGELWRCLRCGLFVAGEPRTSAKLSAAPIVRRGKLLRQVIILRLLAVERLTRAAFLLLLAYAIIKFKSNQDSLARLLNRDLPGLRNLSDSIGYNLDNSAPLRLIHEALKAKQHTLTLLIVGVFAYASLQLIEGVGLWLIKRWGEYFSAVATALFLPLEIYELSEHVTVLKSLTLLINLAAVLYLLITKRLFGLRGGKRAYEAELQTDNLAELQKS